MVTQNYCYWEMEVCDPGLITCNLSEVMMMVTQNNCYWGREVCR